MITKRDILNTERDTGVRQLGLRRKFNTRKFNALSAGGKKKCEDMCAKGVSKYCYSHKQTRKSPSWPANAPGCQGTRKRGQGPHKDKWYLSTPNIKGIYTWKPEEKSTAKKPAAKKRKKPANVAKKPKKKLAAKKKPKKKLAKQSPKLNASEKKTVTKILKTIVGNDDDDDTLYETFMRVSRRQKNIYLTVGDVKSILNGATMDVVQGPLYASQGKITTLDKKHYMFQYVDDVEPLGFFSGNERDNTDIVGSSGGGDAWLKANKELLAFLKKFT